MPRFVSIYILAAPNPPCTNVVDLRVPATQSMSVWQDMLQHYMIATTCGTYRSGSLVQERWSVWTSGWTFWEVLRTSRTTAVAVGIGFLRYCNNTSGNFVTMAVQISPVSGSILVGGGCVNPDSMSAWETSNPGSEDIRKASIRALSSTAVTTSIHKSVEACSPDAATLSVPNDTHKQLVRANSGGSSVTMSHEEFTSLQNSLRNIQALRLCKMVWWMRELPLRLRAESDLVVGYLPLLPILFFRALYAFILIAPLFSAIRIILQLFSEELFANINSDQITVDTFRSRFLVDVFEHPRKKGR
ncbi:hypothetical protein EVAR_97874_1 [Eumeta japonica]|uniref:Uncharacterized protein n=1 Tax=Eumeta variegata TaxID=151549 RepID=A0A4C1WDY3_EUMVA|nr:hypothetical protein EVAR_97874_1 [Eumeta japonica]